MKALKIFSFILTLLLIVLSGCSNQEDKKNLEDDKTYEKIGETIDVSFQELWDRFTNMPKEYSVSWSENLVGSKYTYIEHRKSNNWAFKTMKDGKEDFYEFFIGGKGFLCDVGYSPLKCSRDPISDEREQVDSTIDLTENEKKYNKLYEKLDLLPYNMAQSTRNTNSVTFYNLERLPLTSLEPHNPSFIETVETIKISKKTFSKNDEKIDCYYFTLTSTYPNLLKKSIEETNKMKEGTESEEERKQFEEMIEMLQKEAGSSNKNAKACFNEFNILTYQYFGDDSPPDTINELELFSPTVEDDSVFELPYDYRPTYLDIMNSDNIENCEETEDRYTMHLCFTMFAVREDDPSLCNKINENGDEYGFISCVDRFVKNGKGYFDSCPSNVNCGGERVCAVPVACIDENCDEKIQADWACYTICDENPDCGASGASEIIRPICNTYEVVIEDEKIEKQLCV